MNLNQSPFVTTGASEELDCVVTGAIPEDLSGTLLRTAPAGLTLGDWRAEHWFDGLCLLYRFTLGPQPRFKAAWLNSDYLREVQDNRVTAGSFGTRRNPGFWQWLLHPIGTITDNANVNVACYGDDICALTESEQTHRLDVQSLQSRGRLTYSGNVPATAIPTAHPRYHVTRRQVINVATALSGQSKIYIVEQHGDGRRTVLNEYAVAQWPYIHDFGLSENHAVIMAHPCTLKPWTMLWSTGGLCKKLHYDKSKGSRLIVLPLNGGKARVFEVEGCFVFHFFNAFETADELVVDVAAHHHEAPLSSLSIQNLSDGTPSLGGIPTRFRMQLRTGTVTTERLSDVLCEFPQIAYQRCHGRPYRFGYGASARKSPDGYQSHLIKLDTQTGALQSFSDASWIPGEALFVPRRTSHAEDDGYLLSVASHVSDQRSRLWILDASDLSDVATVDVPHLVPLGFHGQFFRDVDG